MPALLSILICISGASNERVLFIFIATDPWKQQQQRGGKLVLVPHCHGRVSYYRPQRIVLLSEARPMTVCLFYFLLLLVDNNGDNWGEVILVPRRPLCAYDSVTYLFNWYCNPTTTMRMLARLHSYPLTACVFIFIATRRQQRGGGGVLHDFYNFIATHWWWQVAVWAPSRANMSIAELHLFSWSNFLNSQVNQSQPQSPQQVRYLPILAILFVVLFSQSHNNQMELFPFFDDFLFYWYEDSVNRMSSPLSTENQTCLWFFSVLFLTQQMHHLCVFLCTIMYLLNFMSLTLFVTTCCF